MLNALIKLWKILSLRQRVRLLTIVVFMTVAAAMEMLGIGALLPIIGVMQAPEMVKSNALLAKLSSLLGNPSSQNFFVAILIGLLVFFLVKNAFLVLLDIFQYKFLSGVQSKLSTNLITTYLHRPYTFHLQVNTAQLIRNVTGEVNTVLYYVMVPIVSLCAESLVILALFLLIVYVDPSAAIFLTVSGSAVLALFYRVLRERNYRIGQDVQENSGKMIQYAQEGLGGVKEIKVMGREGFFKAAFSKHVDKYTRALSKSLIIYKLPGHVIETVFITIFVGVLIFLTLSNKAASAFPLMAVYAAAAFRLIPSLNRIMTSMNLIKQGATSVKLVASELSTTEDEVEKEPLAASPAFEKEISLVDVHFQYADADIEALRNISLVIKRGEMVGFAGKSGSGKTTLIDCILGLLPPTKGMVQVDGIDIKDHLNDWRKQIGYIPQHIYLTDDSIRKNIALGLGDEAISLDNVWRALEAAQLGEFVRTLPDGLETMIGERGVRLSGGQRQRIGIARAMYYDPKVLIMDEATSALDNETEKAIVKTISGLKGSKTILVIAHRMSTMEDCDRLYFLENGVLTGGGKA
jgi:ATP-binding cassette subfamily C protein